MGSYLYLIIGIIIFCISVILLQINIGGFEYFSNTVSDFTKSLHFNKYIDSIHPDIYRFKVPNSKPDNFKKLYIESLTPLPDRYIQVLKKYTNLVDYKLSFVNLDNIVKFSWNIFMSTNDLEMNMPYTLDNIIVIPKHMLDSMIRSDNLGITDDSFVETLLHEKIHLVQRANQEYFNNAYISLFPFIKRFTGKIPDNLDKKYMTNPDSNFDLWLYKYNQRYYLPLLIVGNNTIRDMGFNIDNLDELINLNKITLMDKLPNNISLYHPNEIFAHLSSKAIMDKDVKNPAIMLLKNI